MRLALLGASIAIAPLGIAAPSYAQHVVGYTTDKPSRLKPIKRKGDAGFPRFIGSVQLSGRFVVERVEGAPGYLRVIFFPDAASAALLPRMTGDRPVEELYFSNWQQAAAALLQPAKSQLLLADGSLGAQGEATILIRDYRIGAVCDRRTYEAELVSASRKAEPVVVASRAGAAGCG